MGGRGLAGRARLAGPAARGPATAGRARRGGPRISTRRVLAFAGALAALPGVRHLDLRRLDGLGGDDARGRGRRPAAGRRSTRSRCSTASEGLPLFVVEALARADDDAGEAHGPDGSRPASGSAWPP